MNFVYIYEQKTKISFEENQFILWTPDEMKRTIPIECLEGVVLFGQIEVTSRVMNKLMEYKIPLTWLSSRGRFFGRLESTESINIQRQRMQFHCGEKKSFVWQLGNNLLKEKFRIKRFVYDASIGQLRIVKWKFLLSRLIHISLKLKMQKQWKS